MNKASLSLLKYMMRKKYIGGKHTSESKAIKRKLTHKDDEEKKEFNKCYKKLINDHIILRVKKMTGKGDDWHIALNPHKMKEINGLIENG